MPSRRNETMDLLKLVSSYMVCFIHIPFPGKIGGAINALARYAVPLFFMISGYYSYQLKPDKIRKRIVHTLKLIIMAFLVYVIGWILLNWIKEGTAGVYQYLLTFTKPQVIIDMFSLNFVTTHWHLWYLLALLYVYVAFYYITISGVKDKWIFAASILLLGMHLCLGEGLSAFGIHISTKKIRNFALFGIPMFGMGLMARKYEDKLKIVPLGIVALCLLLGAAESVLSWSLFSYNELYIGSLLIVFACMVICLKYPNVSYPKWMIKLSQCSGDVYIFHVFIAAYIGQLLYPLLQIRYSRFMLLKYLHPIIVCVVTTAFSCGLQWIRAAIAKKKM